MPSARIDALDRREPARCTRTAQSPRDQGREDEQNNGGDDGPVVPLLAGLPDIDEGREAAQEAQGVEGDLDGPRPLPAAPYPLTKDGDERGKGQHDQRRNNCIERGIEVKSIEWAGNARYEREERRCQELHAQSPVKGNGHADALRACFFRCVFCRGGCFFQDRLHTLSFRV